MRGTVNLLTNPFVSGETVFIPSGSEYTSMAPGVDGIQRTKRATQVIVDRPEHGYTFDEQVSEPKIVISGSGGYWKHIFLNELILNANHRTAEYTEHSVIL